MLLLDEAILKVYVNLFEILLDQRYSVLISAIKFIFT